jgi:hypothetical protein
MPGVKRRRSSPHRRPSVYTAKTRAPTICSFILRPCLPRALSQAALGEPTTTGAMLVLLFTKMQVKNMDPVVLEAQAAEGGLQARGHSMLRHIALPYLWMAGVVMLLRVASSYRVCCPTEIVARCCGNDDHCDVVLVLCMRAFFCNTGMWYCASRLSNCRAA